MELPVNPPTPVRGNPTRIWKAEIVTVNTDGTVDVKSVRSRAIKASVPVPVGYAPARAHLVLCCDLDGDPQTPIVLSRFA